MQTGIVIADTPIETLSARMEHSVLNAAHETIPDSSALDLINVVFALLEQLELVLGKSEYEKFLRELPDRWESPVRRAGVTPIGTSGSSLEDRI
jgi:hypothetical protein